MTNLHKRVKGTLELLDSTPFSDFIRNATASEKKKVYMAAMQRGTEKQNALISEAQNKRKQGEVIYAKDTKKLKNESH